MARRWKGGYLIVSLRCPSCLQPYIRIATLLNPSRTIYVHRETGKAHKLADGSLSERKPTDWCMSANRKGSGNHKSPELLAAIEAAQKNNLENIKKNLASQIDSVVEFNRAQLDYDIVARARLKAMLFPGESIQNEECSQVELEEIKKMPFVGFDFAKLSEEFPSNAVGRAGKPSVAISNQGRVTFSTEVAKALIGCTVAMPSRDKDNPLRLRFDGHVESPKGKDDSCLRLVRPKPNKKTGKVMSKSVSLEGNRSVKLLKKLGYDFARAGNQTYEVEKFDLEKHSVVFSLPATLPAMKSKKVRKIKAKAAAATNGAASNVETITPIAAVAANAAPVAVQVDTDDVVVD